MNYDEFFDLGTGIDPLAFLEGMTTASAARLLTETDGMDDDALEEIFRALEEDNIPIDLSDLPRSGASGEAARRLREEEQLVRKGDLLTGLEQNDPLRLYLQELASIPVCGDAEVLALELLEGKDVANRLVNLSLSRVVELAQEHTGRGVLLMDLIQEGSLGLWQAITAYEGGDIEAHCRRGISRVLARTLTVQARENGVGRKMQQAMADYQDVDQRLLGELGRNPTLEEIAQQLHMSCEETAAVKEMLDSARMLNRTREEEPETEADEQAVEDTAYFQMRQRIAELLEAVTREEAALLKLRFGLEGGKPISPEETGARLGLTPQEVVAVEAAALAKLRNSL